MFGIHKRVIVAIGAAMVLAGATVGATALAATPTPGPGGSQSQNYQQVFMTKLAAALGIDQTKLTDSVKQASKDTIDEAVKNGDLAQNRANDLKSRIDQGNGQGSFGPFGGKGLREGRGMPNGRMFMGNDVVIKAIADKLGMTVQDLQTQLRSGKSLTDLATAKGVSETDLRTAVTAAMKTQLDQAVKDGKITQAQEDAMLQKMQQAPLPGLGKPGFGGRGGRSI